VKQLDILKTATRLQELTEIAPTMVELGPEFTTDIHQELDEMTKNIERSDPAPDVKRDMMHMIKIVRGTLEKIQSDNDDGEGSSSDGNKKKKGKKDSVKDTYADPEYWENYYKETGDKEQFDWYFNSLSKGIAAIQWCCAVFLGVNNS